MGTQDYRETYLAALEVANSQIEQIYTEYETLQLRKEKLEDVVGALEPFFQNQTHSFEPLHSESIRNEFVQAEPEHRFAEPDFHAEAEQKFVEPVIPAAFSPEPEAILDPLQRRINRALGLAVA